MWKAINRLAKALATHASILGCAGALLASNQLSHGQALIAQGAIDLKGNSIATDSFDSSAPDYPGYWTNSIRKARGDVVTLGTGIGVINIANANIAGRVRVGPGGTMSIAANGSVGDLPWVDASTPGVEPGWFSDDADVSIPNVTIPAVAWIVVPGSGSATIYYGAGTNLYSTNTHVFSHIITASGNYVLNDSGDIYVATNCSVSFKVPSSVGTFAPNYLYVAGAGTNSAKVTCYVDCTNCVLGTSVHPQSWLPQNLVVQGTTNCTSLNYSGNGDFVGALYFPQADFQLSGGGSGIIDFIGSAIVKTVQVNGHYHFHYDEAMWDSKWLPGFPFQQRAAVVGQNISLNNVSFTSVGRLSFQWYFEGNDIPDATNSQFWLRNIQRTNAGLYELLVTNIYGSTTSQLQLAVYDSPIANLQSAGVSTAGVFQVSVAGVPSFNYELEVSTNLVDWAPITTNTSPYIFSDTNAVLWPQQFYRAVYVP